MRFAEFIIKYKTLLLGVGLVIGVFSIFDYLPTNIEVLGISDGIKYVFAFYIVFCGWILILGPGSKDGFTRTVPTRTIGRSPEYEQHLREQGKGYTIPGGVDYRGGIERRDERGAYDQFRKR